MLYRFDFWNNSRQYWDRGSEWFFKEEADKFYRANCHKKAFKIFISKDSGLTWTPQKDLF